MPRKIRIYTDGSTADTNPGVGGWSAVIVIGDGDAVRSKELTGYEAEATNVRMELTAALEGLRFFSANRRAIEVVTDYQPLTRMFNEKWVEKWNANAWKKSNGRKVENQDLVRALVAMNNVHDVTWTHVKGHTGDYYNEKAHDLAHAAAREGKRKLGDSRLPPDLSSKAAKLSTDGQGEGLEGGDTPESTQENLVPLAPLAPIPDPPPVERREYWCVFERKTKGTFFAGPAVRPVSPSESSDAKRREMLQAAFRMNNTRDDPSIAPEAGEPKKKKSFGGLPRFEALPHYWMADRNYTVTPRQIAQIISETEPVKEESGRDSRDVTGNIVRLDSRGGGRATGTTDG